MSSGLELTFEDLPSGIGDQTVTAPAAQSTTNSGTGAGTLNLDELEREAIVRAMENTKGNLSDVARQLGIGRSTLYRKLEQYGLREKK